MPRILKSPITAPNRPYYTIPEIAKIMGMSRQGAEKRLRKAEVYYVRYGKIRLVKRADAARVVTAYFEEQARA